MEDIKKSAFLLGEMMGGGNGLVEMLRMNFIQPRPYVAQGRAGRSEEGKKM